jgi:uncharacterized protein
MPITVASLYRYPVKGLSPERIAGAALRSGEHFPMDRIFAIENGPSGFDPAAPEHQPKIKFLMLMRHERLARLRTRYNEHTGMLTIAEKETIVAEGNILETDGRTLIENYFAATMGDHLRGAPRILAAAPGFRFADSRRGFVSIINLSTVREIGRACGEPGLDPLRFRGNVYLEGLEPWAEFALAGATMQVGAVTLRGIARTDRCAAINVDPVSGARNHRLLEMMDKHYGHMDCGIYAEVISPGTVAQGDELSVVRYSETTSVA